MNNPENNKWLDKELSKIIGSEKIKPDFEQWKQNHPDAVKKITSRANDTQVSQRPLTIRNVIMKNPITKLAAAAIIIAILICINQFGGSINGASVAWSNVTENVEQIPSFICQRKDIQINIEKEETVETEMVMYISSEYGSRIDSYNGSVLQSTYTLPSEKAIVTVMPTIKKYVRHPLTEENLKEMEHKDPKELVKRFMSLDYKELGRKTIDGIEVEGAEVNDQKVLSANFPIESLVARLWIDVKTDLPVLIETEIVIGDGAMQLNTVIDNFQWNVELNKSEFEPIIPEEYTLLER